MNEKAFVGAIISIWVFVALVNMAMFATAVYLLGHYCFHWF